MTRLALSSWETIGHRMWLIATGACSAAERRRMVDEKVAAAWHSGRAVMAGRHSLAALLAPWQQRASANAKRLRKKRKSRRR